MSNPQQGGDPSNTAFDLFDRWMTNRDQPSTPEGGATVGDIEIPDTKASREAARALLEAAARTEPDAGPVAAAPLPAPTPMPTHEPVAAAPAPPTYVPPVTVQAPEAPAVPAAWENPIIPSNPEPVVAPVVEAPVYEAPAPAPVVEAPVYEAPAPIVETPVYEAPAPAPVVETPVYEAPAPIVETPVADAPAVPSIGKRRAAVAPDSGTTEPTVSVSGGKRRRHVDPEPELSEPELAETKPALDAPQSPAPAFVWPTSEPVVEETPSPQPVFTWPPEGYAPPAEPVTPAATIDAPAIVEPASLEEYVPEAVAVTEAAPSEPVGHEPAPAAFDEPLRPSPSVPAADWDPLTAPLAVEDLDEDEGGHSHLRLIVSVLMLVGMIGVGALTYLLFKGDHWALRPTASLSAVTVFLTAARFVG